jgi:hypothetical protein
VKPSRLRTMGGPRIATPSTMPSRSAMADIPTLRKHEAALRGLRRSQPSHHTHDPFVDALDYALARLREDIAREKTCTACGGSGRVHRPQRHFSNVPCEGCKGTGRRS